MAAPTPLFFLLTLLSWNGQAADVTVSPQSVVTPIYTTATFTCEGTRDTLLWLVQAAPLTPAIQQERDITFADYDGPGNLSSVLTVTALPINNGIGIGCFIASISAFSNSATLTITGISPVKDLQLDFTLNNSLIITWSSPVYYSIDIPLESAASYNVLLTNKTGDIIVDTTTINTFIEIDNITQCDTFDVSVTALRGQYVSINNTGRNNGSLSNPVHIEKNSQNFLKPSVTFYLNCPPSKCLSILTVTADYEVIDQHLFNGSNKNVSYTRELLPSRKYNYTIQVLNLRNKLEYENFTIITTYQVSGLNIINQYTNGSVNVQCVFVSGSTADGCHVIFTDTNNGRNESFNITLPEESKQVSLSTSGIYNVTAYDIYNGSVYGPAVQYPTPLSVVILILSASSTSSFDTSSTLFSEYSSSNSVITTSSTVSVETETATSSPTTGSVLYVIAGVISIVVLIIIIILTVMVLLVVIKRAAKKRNVYFNSGRAACHRPQAEINDYHPVLIEGVTSNREDPYHVTGDEISAIRNARPVQLYNSPPTTTTTIPSIEIQSHDSSESSPYLDNHETYSLPSNSSIDHSATVTVSGNSAAYAIVTINNNDTTTHADHCTISDVPVTIDDDDENTNDLPPPLPPPPYEEVVKQDFNGLHFNLPNTLFAPSHPEEETSQPNTWSHCVPPAPAKPVTDEWHFVSVNQSNTVIDGQIVHNGAQYGTESSTSDYETPLPGSDANGTASAFFTHFQFLGEASLEEQSNDRCLVSIVCLSTPPPSPPNVTFSCSSGSSTIRNDLVTSSHGSLIPDDDEVVENQPVKQKYGKDVFGMMVISPFALHYKPNIAVIVEDINNEALPLCSKKLKEEDQCSKFIFEECVASSVVSKGPKKAMKKPKKSHMCFGPRKTRKKVLQDKMKAQKKKKAKNAYKRQSFSWVYAIVFKMAKNNKAIAPKKVFKRDKGSVKSANGFSPQITVNYNLQTKSYKVIKLKCLLLFARKAYITRLSIALTGGQPEFQNIVVYHALLHCRCDDDCYTDSGGDALINASSSATHALLNNEQYIVFERDKDKPPPVTNCIASCVCLYLISTIIYSATAGLPLLALYSSTSNKNSVLCDLSKTYARICISQTKSNTAVSANVILTGSATSNTNLDCIENSPATICLTRPAMPYNPDPPWYWYLSSLLSICAFTSSLKSQVQQSSLNNEKVFDMIKNGRYLHCIQNCTVIPFVLHLLHSSSRNGWFDVVKDLITITLFHKRQMKGHTCLY